MKKFLSKKYLPLWLSIAAIVVSVASLVYFVPLTQEPTKEFIPLGFTWADENAEGFTLEEFDLRVMYTTGLTTVENPEVGGDPWMIYGGSWFYRTTAGNPFKVVVVQGQEVIASFDDIMSVSNDAQFCTEDQQPCRSGRAWLLTVDLKPIYIETTAQQYIVINP